MKGTIRSVSEPLGRKPIRLPNQEYASPDAVCSVTLATRARAQIFVQLEHGAAALRVLRTLAEEMGVPVYAYCFMPEHFHLVLAASESCSILDFVNAFTSRTTRTLWAYGYAGAIWQRRFYDHFVRRDEDLAAAVEYVLYNPVRAGLVADAREHPFSGVLARLDGTR
jgi:putative transposase